MTLVMHRPEIESALASADVVAEMKDAFLAYSNGQCIVPPPGELMFEEPPGEAHIKFGYRQGDDIFVVKVATGFYRNGLHGLATCSGLVIAFDRRTGFPLAILLDEGHLTNLRTAAAGAVAARYLSPRTVSKIAVLGTGTQAQLQVEMLKRVTDCRFVSIWGRSLAAADRLAGRLWTAGFATSVAATPAQAVEGAQLVVTTTASECPLLGPDDISEGTHITAVGSDTPAKQELSVDLICKADRVVTDSVSQCLDRGELHHALQSGRLRESDIVEMGQIIASRASGRTDERQITIADLTGVAIQDIVITKAVLRGRTPERTRLA